MIGRVVAAAVATAWLTPLAASVASVTLFEAGVRPAGTVLLWGIAAAVGVWLLAGLAYAPSTGASRANRRSYSLLINRIEGLLTLHDGVCNGARGRTTTICAEAKRQLHGVKASLGRADAGWFQGSGYIGAWETVHRVDEALIELLDRYDLLEVARHDILRLDGSTLPHRDDLLELARAAQAYLCGEKQKDSCVDNIDEARKALKEVRANINVFRDSSWNGLVVLRNQTLVTLVILHLLVFGLLALALFGGASQHVIEALTLYFLVGAILGVFNRLYAQSQADTAVDDYGVAIARLLTLPAFSGLAAIGGVLLTSLTAAQSAATGLGSVFDFQQHPLVLLDAAAFGLAPGLLVQGLAKRGQKYQSDIKSTEPTDGGSNGNAGH